MRTKSIAVAVLSLAVAAPVGAQTWPSKPVTLVVGYPAGSGPDILARFLAQALRERTEQPFIVDNKPGALGSVSAQLVARAAPDGYTVLFIPISMVLNVHLFKHQSYDPVKDFTPVTTAARSPYVLLVNPAVVPAKSVVELTQYIKGRADKLAYGAAGTSGRVATELYFSYVGVKVTHVPYQGANQALNDLLGGRIHFLFADATFGIPQLRGGKVRALAVSSAQRLSAAPDIPTMAEVGLPGYEIEGWYSLYLPANAPKPVAQKLAELCNASMASESAREFLKKLASDPYPGSPESLSKLLVSEIEKWGRLIKAAGIEPIDSR